MEKLFIQHPEMQSLWEYDEEYKGLPKERRKIHHYCGMLQSLFEIAFIASPLSRGWMTEEEWDGWEQFIKELTRESEDFRLAWEHNKDFYCKKYRDYMEEILKLVHPKAVEAKSVLTSPKI